MEWRDRVPKQRYFDPDFYAMEAELLWPRVWQMACRLEEIPEPRDFVEYEFLDQSIIVLRTDAMGVRAFQAVTTVMIASSVSDFHLIVLLLISVILLA